MRLDSLGRGLGPDNFETTGLLVGAVALTNTVVPSETHLSKVSSLRLRANVLCVTISQCSVGVQDDIYLLPGTAP